MAKPNPLQDEEDALSMVMSVPSEDDAGEELVEATEEEPAEEKPSEASALLDDITAKIEQLRGLVASV